LIALVQWRAASVTATQAAEVSLPSLTVENYVKAIYLICSRTEASASTGGLAEMLKVSPGTVTSMLKTLSEAKLAVYTPYEGVELTPTGQALALRVIRRHRLIELFLVKTLELSWDEVHEEAENMEHAVSDLLVDRIDGFLGHPTVDPHGDPIPTADGRLKNDNATSLGTSIEGDRFRLVRVLDQSPEFLRYLSESGLALGTVGRVAKVRDEAGIITVFVAAGERTLARAAADKLMVIAPD
jgi:DtxR family Mn-dependent transcriptional regulator